VFQADGNYSIADTFARSLPASRTAPRVSADNCNCVYMSMDQFFSLGTARYFAGQAIGIDSGATFALPVQILPSGVINYMFERDSNVRTGAINFSCRGSDVAWTDDYTETADLGVSINLSVDIVDNNMLTLNGTTVDTGEPTKLSFDVKTLS
jgi:hypothetical protein